jgi:hypothetical protein
MRPTTLPWQRCGPFQAIILFVWGRIILSAVIVVLVVAAAKMAMGFVVNTTSFGALEGAVDGAGGGGSLRIFETYFAHSPSSASNIDIISAPSLSFSGSMS